MAVATAAQLEQPQVGLELLIKDTQVAREEQITLPIAILVVAVELAVRLAVEVQDLLQMALLAAPELWVVLRHL